jgi:hypothetical protein
MKLPLTGGSPTPLSSSVVDYPVALAVGATMVFWVTHGGSIVSAPK